MRLLPHFLILTLGLVGMQSQAETWDSLIYSHGLNDDYEIIILTPESYKDSSDKEYSMIFFPDAQLNSGKELIKLYHHQKIKTFSEEYILVGLQHTGDIPAGRRRDLILGDSNTISVDFGRSFNFLQFVKDTVLPLVKTKYRIKEEGSCFYGHSFGGFFGTYCMLEEPLLFEHYICLSPSLWVSNRVIFEHVKDVNAELFISAGSAEILNKIYPSVDDFTSVLSQNAKGDETEYKVYPNATHNSYLETGTLDGIRWLVEQ